jgi:hypothetical protein
MSSVVATQQRRRVRKIHLQQGRKEGRDEGRESHSKEKGKT